MMDTSNSRITMEPDTASIPDSRVHVIFGTGLLGMAVQRALTADGRAVRMINRSGKGPAIAGVEFLGVDTLDSEAMDRACAGASVVYQCASPPYHRWDELFPPLQGVILEAAARAGATLVIAENMYMYGDTDGRPLTEDTPMTATTRKGRTRVMMTEAALDAHREGEVRVAIGRGSDFFGPGVLRSAMGERVFPRALGGQAASLLGDIDLPHTYTFIDDFGKALVTLGDREEALGRVWHVPNAATVTTREFVTMVYEEIGAPPRMTAAGRTLLRLFGVFSAGAREMVEMMYEFEKPFIVDSGAFERAFGARATPLRDAIRSTVAWYREMRG